MKLVAIETQDEQQLVTELLTSHLGDRGTTSGEVILSSNL